MTLREMTALLILYRACTDEGARRKVRGMLPELEEIVTINDNPEMTLEEWVRIREKNLGN